MAPYATAVTPDRNATSPPGNAVLTLDVPGVPGPDRLAEPEGFTVTVDSADRIHFLDWGGPAPRAPGILAIHGLAQTAWAWTPVARRLAGIRPFVAMDLRKIRRCLEDATRSRQERG